jgi:hypothetical protein
LRIFFTILFSVCCFAKSQGQNYFPYKAPKQNVAWIDSMKRIVAYDFDVDVSEKNNWKRQLNYVNTCALLGRYWEWAYEKRYVKNMKKALVYYDKVINILRFYGYNEKAKAIRTNVYRKLEDIYFRGKGVKKDKVYALQLALDGIGKNFELIDFYSERYYGKISNINFNKISFVEINDSIFIFKANPFAVKAEVINRNSLFEKMNKVIDLFKLKSNNDSLYIAISTVCRPNSRSEQYTYLMINKITSFLISKEINPDFINTNNEIGFVDDNFLTISFKKI